MVKAWRLKPYSALLAVTAIWGIAGPVIKATLNYLGPFTFLFYRFSLALVFALPLYGLYLRRHPIRRSDLLPLSILGLMATTINLSLIFLGFARTTALDGTLLGAVTPIFIVILGVFYLHEKITRREAVGLAVVIIGSAITLIQPLLAGQALAKQNILGNFLILISGIEWAIFVLFSKKNFSHYPPLLITLHSSIIAFITFLPLAILENPNWLNFEKIKESFNLTHNLIFEPTFWGVFYMAVFSYLAAYWLYEYGMSKIEISEASIFSYLQPIFAAPVAIIFLHEALTAPFLIGAGIIGIGVVLSEYK